MTVVDAGPLLFPHGGVHSGRAQTGFGTAYSFTLGSFLERMDNVDVGDYADLTQDVDLTSIDIIGFRLGLRGVENGFPSDMLALWQYNDFAGQSFAPDYVRDGGQPTITTYGSPAIVAPGVSGFGAGALELNGPDGLLYEGLDLSGIGNIATISFRVKPGYSGTPATGQTLFVAVESIVSLNNAVQIVHDDVTGKIFAEAKDSGGSTAVQLETPFNPDGTSWYHVEFGFDVTNKSYLFVGGALGDSDAASASRGDTLSKVAMGTLLSINHDIVLDELHIYNTVQHELAFTPPTYELGTPNWRFRVFAGANELYRVEFGDETDADFIERAVNVSTLTGTQTIKFRLEAL